MLSVHVIVFSSNLPTTDSIDGWFSDIADLSNEFEVYVKPHHGTLFKKSEEERLRRIQESGLNMISSLQELVDILPAIDVIISDGSGMVFDALLLKKHSDFLNIEYIWGEYLKTGNEVTNRDIDWSELDKAIVNITDGNSNCSNVRLYKITAQCFNERYLRLKQLEEQKYNLLLKELENKRFVVFGAGYFSRQLMDELNRKNLVPQCILVTEKDGTDYLNNIPVKRLTEWTDIEDVVIIAVSGNAQTEIITSLLKCAFSQYYIYPECI